MESAGEKVFPYGVKSHILCTAQSPGWRGALQSSVRAGTPVPSLAGAAPAPFPLLTFSRVGLWAPRVTSAQFYTVRNVTTSLGVWAPVSGTPCSLPCVSEQPRFGTRRVGPGVLEW